MYDSIIFDMDGTLVDFLEEMVVSWNLTCEKYSWNKHITYDELKKCMGLNAHDIGVIMFPDIDENEATRRVEVCSSEEIEYFDKVQIGKTFIPNEEYLKELSKKYRLFIVSNCLKGYIEVFLKKYNYSQYFIDYLNAANGNTKAENIKTIITKHKLQNPVYVGDTIKDKESSLEAGVAFIYASYGFGKVEHNLSINSLEELLEL